MSETLFHNQFSAGWVPSDNYINGRPNGLLQMDNLCLDDNGALISAKSPTVLTSALAGKAHTLFSATISGAQKQLAALDTGDIVEGAAFGNLLVGGGSVSRAAFANVLDQILICSGAVNKKWDGTTLRNAGIAAPGLAPTVVSNASSQLSIANLSGGTNLFTNWTITDGTLVSDTAFAYALTPDATNNLGQITTTYGATLDTLVFPSGFAGTPDDIFTCPVIVGDGSNTTGIQIRIYPDNGSGGFDLSSAFIKTWDTSNTNIPIGVNGKLNLQCTRGDFNSGTDAGVTPSFDKWKTIRGIVIFFYGTTNFTYTFGDMLFTGGINTLTANYEYLQVNVYNTGKYLAQSAVSAIAKVSPHVASVHVTPYITGIDAQVTEVWIFRRNVDTESDYYRVHVSTTPFAAFDDVVTDTTAELVSIKANLYLSTLATLTTGIKTIIGIWFDRVLYFDDKNVYFSDRLNADSIDSRKTITYSGNTSEVFLWAKKVTNSVILVATDLDIYEMTGTFSEFPDGTLDCSFRNLAVKNPPVSIGATVYSSSVLYQAADGWRMLDGVNSTPLTESLDVLYKNTSKYGYAPITDGYFAGQLFANAEIANKKLYITQKDIDGFYRCFIYDLSRKYWYNYVSDFYALGVREDGTIFGSTYAGLKIYDLESGTSTVAVVAQFPVQSNGSPRNRKDSYTFKIRANTGGSSLTIQIYKDQSTTPIAIGTINTNSMVETQIDISSSVGICKNYQIRLSGTIAGLMISDYSIDYDLRPPQLTHLRKSPDNSGTAMVKQYACLPFVIDTLGTDVTFAPTLDGISQSAQTFNTPDKETCIYYFTSDKIAVDVGGVLNGLFEFYGWLNPEVLTTLQVMRKFDNVGPIEFIKNARLLAFRFRLYSHGCTNLQISVFADDSSVYDAPVTLILSKEVVYEVIVPRGVQGAVFQFEFRSNDGNPFSRQSFEYKAICTGASTDNGWETIKNK